MKNYNVNTEYGSTVVSSDSSDYGISNTYSNTHIKSKEIEGNIHTLMNYLLKNFKINPYGMAYFQELETSYAMYGMKGLKTQLLYFFSNSRSVTEGAKRYRKNVQSGGNPFTFY